MVQKLHATKYRNYEMWIEGTQEGIVFRMDRAAFRLLPDGKEIAIPLEQAFIEIHATSVGAKDAAFKKIQSIIDGLIDGQTFNPRNQDGN